MAAGPARGRRIVIAFIVVLLFVSLAVAALHTYRFGTVKIASNLIRTALEVSLLYWVYRGSVLAKWVLIVLAGLAGTLALRWTIDSGAWLSFLVTLPYFLFAAALLWSKSVDEFLDRDRKPPDAVPPWVADQGTGTGTPP